VTASMKHAWQGAIDATLAETAGRFTSAVVVDVADSTQDEARRRGCRPGTVVAARRQTAGRGRLGRRWLDERGEGAAVTLVVEADDPARLAVAAGLAGAKTVEGILGRATGLKWPNDLILDGRKLGGVLVEQSAGIAFIGVGINVAQTAWPPELAGRAISLRQAGAAADVLDVVCGMVRCAAETLLLDQPALLSEFRERDAMTGQTVELLHGGRRLRGQLRAVDPFGTLELQTDVRRTVAVPAAQARLLPPEERDECR